MLNICPSCNDRAEHHEAEGEKRHASDGATEPEDLSIGDQDNCQVLEYSIDWNREELKSFGAGIDHDNEGEGHGEPWKVSIAGKLDLLGCLTFSSFIRIKVSILYDSKGFTTLYRNHTNNRLPPSATTSTQIACTRLT